MIWVNNFGSQCSALMRKFICCILLFISPSGFAVTIYGCNTLKSAFVSANAFNQALGNVSQKILSQLGEVNCDQVNYGDVIYMGCNSLKGRLLYGTWECYRRDDDVYYYFIIDTKTLGFKIVPAK